MSRTAAQQPGERPDFCFCPLCDDSAYATEAAADEAAARARAHQDAIDDDDELAAFDASLAAHAGSV